MIRDEDLPELAVLRQIEESLPLKPAPDYGTLVVSRDNDSLPIHRWFRYKEAYSAGLLQSLLSEFGLESRHNLILLDPFCGVGTTLLSAQTRSIPIGGAIGIERNPFSTFVARTKLSWPSIDVEQFQKRAIEVLGHSESRALSLPAISSISRGRCISKHIAGRILTIRDVVRETPDPTTRDALLLGLASAIEPLSRVRKDGRALRLVERSHQRVDPVLKAKWNQIASDVLTMRANHSAIAPTVVHESDGRNLRNLNLEDESVDLVVTSPPYPNNIDYSEVYKLELWMLGFVRDATEFLALRKSTLRSHPTSNLDEHLDSDFFAATSTLPMKELFEPMLARLANLKQPWRRKLVLGYFSDLWIALREQYRVLRKNGRAFLVVGNSLHGQSGSAYLIATDLLTSQIGVAAGFELEKILVARSTRRRLSGNHFLRESIVVLRKPNV